MDFTSIPLEVVTDEILSFADLDQLYDNRYLNRTSLERYTITINRIIDKDPTLIFELTVNKDDPELAAELVERYPNITGRLLWISARYGSYAVVLYLLEFLEIQPFEMERTLGRLIELTERAYPEYVDVVVDRIAELYLDRILSSIMFLFDNFLFGRYDLLDSNHGRPVLSIVNLIGRSGQLTPDVLDKIRFEKFPRDAQRRVYRSLAEYNQITPELIDYLFE